MIQHPPWSMALHAHDKATRAGYCVDRDKIGMSLGPRRNNAKLTGALCCAVGSVLFSHVSNFGIIIRTLLCQLIGALAMRPLARPSKQD